MSELGVSDIPLIGVAKGVNRNAGREESHRLGKSPMALGHNAPLRYYIQRLRDEVHRFAIGAHRQTRARGVGATPLDEIPGVGAARKRALLQHFGSAKAVGRADLADLKAVDGISGNLAETISAFFRSPDPATYRRSVGGDEIGAGAATGRAPKLSGRDGQTLEREPDLGHLDDRHRHYRPEPVDPIDRP